MPKKNQKIFDIIFYNLTTWKRYIDVLILWKGDRARCDAFLEWVDNLDPHLRFSRAVDDATTLLGPPDPPGRRKIEDNHIQKTY